MNSKNLLFVAIVSIAVVGSIVGGVLFLGDDGGENVQASSTADTTETTIASGTETTAMTGTETRTEMEVALGQQTETSTPTATLSSTTTGPSLRTSTASSESSIDRVRLETAIEHEINEYRAANGLDRLRVNGTTSEALNRLTRNHSQDMKKAGKAWRLPGNYDFQGLYEHYNLYRTCRFKSEAHVVVPDDGRIMAVQRIDVSSGDEADIAAQVMDTWESDRYHGDKFDYENAEIVDVGIAVDAEMEKAYIAMSLC